MDNPFGDAITNPLENSYGDVDNFGGGGLIGFLSNIFKFITIAGGVYLIFNLVIAGFTYVTSGHDPKQTAAAWQKIYMSLIGMVVMVAAYALAGIVGWVLFGDASAILNPQIYGPGVTQTP